VPGIPGRPALHPSLSKTSFQNPTGSKRRYICENTNLYA
ncbi:MAG: hypothetical protein ACJA0J_002747, partial [Bdellovibrionota bacterium]